MIPTMIVFGLALGRWWKTAIIAAAILWPALLLSGGVLEGSPGDQVGGLIGGSVLAVLNTAVGVAAHQALRLAVDGAVAVVRTVSSWFSSPR